MGNAKIVKFKCDIMSGQKFIKNFKNVTFDEFLKAITRQVNFNMTKIGEKSQNSKIQMRHF